MREISSRSCVSFRPCVETDDRCVLYNVTLELDCYSMAIGRSATKRRQVVGLGFPCWWKREGEMDQVKVKHRIVHEIMHALGFWHEHCRPDRDDYITVNVSNVQEGQRSNFEKAGVNDVTTLGIPYDFGSLLHYPLDYAHSVDSTRYVMKVKQQYESQLKTEGIKVGQENHLAESDIQRINKLYQCNRVQGRRGKTITGSTSLPVTPTSQSTTTASPTAPTTPWLPRECSYSSWGDWSKCDCQSGCTCVLCTTCGEDDYRNDNHGRFVMRARLRKVTSQGRSCQHDTQQKRFDRCDCPKPTTAPTTSASTTPWLPHECSYSSWSRWSSCDCGHRCTCTLCPTCGEDDYDSDDEGFDLRTRSRRVTRQGRNCARETRQKRVDRCNCWKPTSVLTTTTSPCSYSSWSDWSSCTCARGCRCVVAGDAGVGFNTVMRTRERRLTNGNYLSCSLSFDNSNQMRRDGCSCPNQRGGNNPFGSGNPLLGGISPVAPFSLDGQQSQTHDWLENQQRQTDEWLSGQQRQQDEWLENMQRQQDGWLSRMLGGK